MNSLHKLQTQQLLTRQEHQQAGCVKLLSQQQQQVGQQV
jgi:hypothetical protein